MFPLRDYTEPELMALPADSRLLFADSLADGLLVYDNPPSPRGFAPRRRRVLKNRLTVSQTHLTSALSRVRALRCISHGLSAFSLYPTTDQQCHVNRFLWQAANDFSFKAAEAATLFHKNVFIISMPAPLFDFLTSVTWEEFEQAMLFVLLKLPSDTNSLQILHDELAPTLGQASPHAIPPESCNPRVFKRLLDLVMDRIIWMGPWVIPTTLCYLSASDMTELLAHRYERPIFSTPEKFELVHTMMWNIFRDWQTYRHILVKLGGRSHLEALELMARTISKGTQCLVDEGIRTLLQIVSAEHCCNDITFDLAHSETTPPPTTSAQKNFLSTLPTDVVVGSLIPRLCEVYASDESLRRRSPATLSTIEVRGESPPVRSIPFSLKNWVLEDPHLHNFYISITEEEEKEDESEPPEEMQEFQEEEPEEDGGAENPRAQRRRLNEAGSFHVVPSEGDTSGTGLSDEEMVELEDTA